MIKTSQPFLYFSIENKSNSHHEDDYYEKKNSLKYLT